MLPGMRPRSRPATPGSTAFSRREATNRSRRDPRCRTMDRRRRRARPSCTARSRCDRDARTRRRVRTSPPRQGARVAGARRSGRSLPADPRDRAPDRDSRGATLLARRGPTRRLAIPPRESRRASPARGATRRRARDHDTARLRRVCRSRRTSRSLPARTSRACRRSRAIHRRGERARPSTSRSDQERSYKSFTTEHADDDQRGRDRRRLNAQRARACGWFGTPGCQGWAR